MFDVDDFKRFNDKYGHQVGDMALVALARVLRDTLRADIDIICRYGGDEFAALLPNTTLLADAESAGGHDGLDGHENLRAEGALATAERLRTAVEQHCRNAVQPTLPESITVSIGVSAVTDQPLTPDELVAAADKALYLAKRRGQNRVASFCHGGPLEAVTPV